MPTRAQHDFEQRHPQPGDDPVARLQHTLDLFDNQPDGEFVVIATSGMYGDGVRTGLTWGDLRKLADQLGA